MEPPNKPEDLEYKDKYDKIHNVIEDINTKLVGMFRRREEQLLQEYKTEMFKAQAELDQLRENTNEQELKRRMAEKKEQLESEREQFRQASVFFSGKCQTFKHKLQKVMAETKDLENEIKFLNDQIHNAQKKNMKLKDQLETVKKHPSQRFDEISVSLGTKKDHVMSSSIDQTSHVKRRIVNKSPISNNRLGQIDPKKIQQKNAKLRNLIDDPIFKQTQLQSLFLQSVNAVKQKKNSRMSSLKAKLPMISKETSSGTNVLNEGILSDFDKRLIMEDFLSREQVKKFLYGIIFKDVAKTQSEGGVLNASKQIFQ